MIQIYTGNGKGKTTAALGVAVRMLGHKKRVCLIQFMKKNYRYGEIQFLKEQPNIDIFQFGSDQLIQPGKASANDIQEAASALAKVYEVLKSDLYDLIIIDEINLAVAWELISLTDQMKIFDLPTNAEIIMTGRSAHQDVMEKADLVTEMKEVKHYYQKQIPARKGIEF